MADLELISIFRKTEVGVDAIKLRDRTLTPKQRMLLILVDGSKTIGDLIRPMPNPDESLQLLSELLSSGYICEANPSPSVVKPTPVAPRVSSQASLQAAIQRTTRLLDNLLGPDSEPLCLQLERCKTFDEFTTKVQEFRRIVTSMRSEKKAEEFVSAALNT